MKPSETASGKTGVTSTNLKITAGLRLSASVLMALLLVFGYGSGFSPFALAHF